MRTKTIPFALILLVFSISDRAAAHACLDHADPKVGADVAKAPAEIRIWFNEPVEPAFSTIEVFDASGNQVDKRDTHLDSKDNTLLIVSVPASSGGKFKVVWKVVAKDTHRTNGEFKFTVKTAN